jgi:hypothetical protein
MTSRSSQTVVEPSLAVAVEGDAGAMMLADLMPTLVELDRTSVIQFWRMLGHHLAFDGRAVARRREARLGLMLSLVSHGELPPVSRYEQARKAEAAAGREWPGASALRDGFGSYVFAVRAAVRFLAPLTPRASIRHRRERVRPYSREEILAAIERCRVALASPGQMESGWHPPATTFFLWNSIGREAARKLGRPDPRLPCREALARQFGSYDDAVEAARRRARLDSLPPARPGAKPRPRRPRSEKIRL